MGTYVQLMPRMVQRRMEEMESKAAESAKAAEASASSSAQASPASQSPVPSASPLQEPLFTPPVTHDAPGAQAPLATPIGLDFENNSPVSHAATAPEGKFSAAAPLTPATEEGFLHNPGEGASHAARFPQPPIATTQITLESSSLVALATPKPSSSADAATVSKPTGIPLPSEPVPRSDPE